MANVLIDDSHLYGIAAAIRAKYGTSRTYKPGEMAAALNEKIVIRPFNEEYDDSVSNLRFGLIDLLWNFIELDTAGIIALDAFFAGAYLITNIPYIDTSSCENTDWMFDSCYGLQTIPLIDTGNVVTMQGMFYDCRSLETVPNLDTKNVVEMSYMFAGCSSLTAVSDLDANKVRQQGGLEGFLDGCENVTSIGLYNFKDTLDLSPCPLLGADALNAVFAQAKSVNPALNLRIIITGCAGASTCNKNIAISKGWTVEE